MPRVFAALALSSLLAACASKDATPPAAQEGASPPMEQSLGAACDPSLRVPCVLNENICNSVVCDPVSLRCVEHDESDRYPICRGIVDAAADATRECTSDNDCPGTDTGCGYAIADGCTALGHCVTVYGGGFCQELFPRCACNGKSFSECAYQDGYASAPVRHSGACADGGATDASTDGATE